jgi:hypothetical protein
MLLLEESAICRPVADAPIVTVGGPRRRKGPSWIGPIMYDAGHELWQLAFRAVLATGVASCAGCYDSQALLDQVRTDALRSRTHEIDLGFYRTTMPRDQVTNTFAEMELQMFGTVPQYRIQAIEKQLKADGYRLRAATLAAIRETSAKELAEPDLNQLRARLTVVANSVLEDAPIKTIGFEHVRIVD